MKSKTIRKIYIGLLFVLLIVLLPLYMGLPEQTFEKTLVLAFGIDKTGQDFELSAQVMVPHSSQSGYNEKREVRNSTGKTIDEAMASLQLKEGKKLALAHANILVISESAIGDDINIIMDYFVRERDIGYLTVVTTPSSAKDLLDISSQETFDKDSLLRLVSFNNENIHGTESTLNKILFGYYSPSQTSVISRLMVSGSDVGSQSSGEQSGGDSAGGGSSSTESGQSSGGSSSSAGGQSAQQSSGQQSSAMSGSSGGTGGQSSGGGSKTLDNDGSVAVLKAGKLVKVLNPLEYRGFHWLMPIKSSSFIKLEDVSDKNFQNATVVVDIENAKDKVKYELTNDGTPIIKFNTKLKYQISSVQQDEYIVNSYAEFINDSSKSLEQKLQRLVDAEVQQALSTAKEYQIDVWNVYDKFYQKYGNKFIKYVDSNEGDYLKDLEIYVQVSVEEDKI